MPRTLLFVGFVAILTLACVPQGAVGTGDHKATMLMLPEGEPEAGRNAFIELGCASCHAVAWDSDLPVPVAAGMGPELGLDAARPGTGSLATSIVAPSHHVPKQYQGRTAGGASPMMDYTGRMTIRELADIVAYLERQGAETQAKTGQAAPG